MKKEKKNEQPFTLNVHTYYNTVTRYILQCAQWYKKGNKKSGNKRKT